MVICELRETAGISFLQPVIAPLAKLLDWSFMQAAVLMMPANDLDLQLEEGIQPCRFLTGELTASDG
jgi:hypothetical protein